ncbi:Transcriptional regulator [Methanosarcina barkeri 3]|uniref:Transcriptional regulator n=1 Tax=Methanosarcina barkeri 3 TaxID=1434107 RepID=A0A0E3SPH6_METBA|nr:PspC domain-containing protein [Methanosarcina barkeri]AKB83678.1 Transcriptional regulator [Methanosarcina barkeri 3]
MQENPESQEKKVTKKSFFEVPGIAKAESERGTSTKPGGKTDVTSGSGAPLQREEPKKSEFKPQGDLETGYKEESWKKPEDMEEVVESPAFKERKVPDKSDFKAQGELETGYTERSWTKPIDMEGRVIIEPGEKKEEFSREAREKVKEESRKAQEEAGGEKRTTYTMKKRLTKSKKERMLFGVCGGLGEYFGIDPTFIRLAFAALALQGIGIVLYIILAIIMPSGEGYKMISSSGQ